MIIKLLNQFLITSKFSILLSKEILTKGWSLGGLDKAHSKLINFITFSF